jgi:hypothetical protein
VHMKEFYNRFHIFKRSLVFAEVVLFSLNSFFLFISLFMLHGCVTLRVKFNHVDKLY